MRRGVLDEEKGMKDVEINHPSLPQTSGCALRPGRCISATAPGSSPTVRCRERRASLSPCACRWDEIPCFKTVKKCQEREPMKHPYGGLLHT